MSSLHELSSAYQAVLNNEDLDPEVMVDTLDSIKEPLKDKADNIAWVIEELTSNAEILKDKAKSFKEEAAHEENKAKWLKQYLTDCLDNAEIKKLQTDSHIISVRNFKASTVVDDESALPADYLVTKEITKPDKQRLYEVLKAGEQVPGAHLENNRGTVIK